MTGGWGNCGGGMAIMIMGYILRGLPRRGHVAGERLAPVLLHPRRRRDAGRGVHVLFSDECPSGKLSDALAAGKEREGHGQGKQRAAASTNLNSWILFVQYATCFGIELHINNGMAMYFKDTYLVSLATAGLIASLFGWMNLFARGLGGYFSDLANAKLGMQGRIIVHTLYLLAEGAILVIFSRVDSIAHAIITLVLFSCCVQAAEGTTFAIVPVRRAEGAGQRLGRRRRRRQRRRRRLGPDVHVRRQRQDGLPQPGHHHHGLCFVVGLHQDQGRRQPSSATTTRLRGTRRRRPRARRSELFGLILYTRARRPHFTHVRPLARPLSVGCSPVPSIRASMTRARPLHKLGAWPLNMATDAGGPAAPGRGSAHVPPRARRGLCFFRKS